MISRLLKGWYSLLFFVITGKAIRGFLKFRYPLFSTFLILGALGIIRLFLSNTFEGMLSVSDSFYRIRIDIVLVMSIFAIYLCFFGSAVLRFFLYRINIRKLETHKKVFSFVFYIQIVHLIIPFIDFIGIKLGMPTSYRVLPDWVVNYLIFNKVYFSPGILLAWIIVFIAMTKFLTKLIKVNFIHATILQLMVFTLIFWPVYMLFGMLNYIFEFTTLILNLNRNPCISPECLFSTNTTFYGYFTFFFILSVLSIMYNKDLFKRRIE